MASLKDIDFQKLTFKTVTLMALTCGQRCQTSYALEMTLTSSCCTFQITKLLKVTKQSNHFRVLKVMTYFPDKSVYVVSCMEEYLKRTKSVRSGCKILLIS